MDLLMLGEDCLNLSECFWEFRKDYVFLDPMVMFNKLEEATVYLRGEAIVLVNLPRPIVDNIQQSLYVSSLGP